MGKLGTPCFTNTPAYLVESNNDKSSAQELTQFAYLQSFTTLNNSTVKLAFSMLQNGQTLFQFVYLGITYN